MVGNTKLVEYGVQTEKSDFRIHVCPAARSAYVFSTSAGADAVLSGQFRIAPAYQGNVKTAIGHLVPPEMIEGCLQFDIPAEFLSSVAISETDGPSEKSKKSLALAKMMLSSGLLKMPLMSEEVEDKDLQIEGVDVLVTASHRIQVKCDYRGGAKALGGTGNLFLQTHECNPLSLH